MPQTLDRRIDDTPAAPEPARIRSFVSEGRARITSTESADAFDAVHPQGESCPGCGVVLPSSTGAKHPYIGASAGCWAAYGDVLAREYGEWGYPSVHRLTVDTYAAQHPGEPTPKATQSVAVHLVALHLSLERGVEPARITREIGRAVANPSVFRWLEPPEPGGQLTIADVVGARDLREHTARVQRWARSVWEAWAPHHETIRRWAAG